MLTRASSVAILAALALGSLSRADAQTPLPLLGAMYSHTSLAGCNLDNTGIVRTYHTPGTRRLVRSQLAAMRKAGLSSLRIILWNMTDDTGQRWGVLPSAGGRLSEPYRSNLVRFASDVAKAGFQRLTVAFSPQWTNNPIGEYGPSGLIADRWDPSKFEENWSFIADARRLVEPVGPTDTRWDFFQESPPTRYQPAFIVERMNGQIREMWTRYVRAYGGDDVTVSTIIKGPGTEVAVDRLQHLLDAIRSTGLGYPTWFEVHGDWTSPDLYQELRAIDETLTANGLTTQPLVVGESSYENAATASDVTRFMATSSRRIDEIYQWWQRSSNGPCYSAPYRADAYAAALGLPLPPPTPSPLPLLPVPTLSAAVSSAGRVVLRNETGRTVVALNAGRYRIVMQDRSRRYDFRLTGPGFQLASGAKFTGRRVWNAEIGLNVSYGTVFSYSSALRGTRRSIVVR